MDDTLDKSKSMGFVQLNYEYSGKVSMLLKWAERENSSDSRWQRGLLEYHWLQPNVHIRYYPLRGVLPRVPVFHHHTDNGLWAPKHLQLSSN